MRFFLLFLLLPVLLFSQNVSKEIGELNSALKRGALYSSVVNSLATSDKLLLFLENFMLDSIPSLKNYTLYNTNTFSRVTMEKGNYEIEIYSQKYFSNNISELLVTIDGTEDIFNKNFGLYLSYDYLSEKKNFKKLEIQKVPALIENNSLIMLFIISTNQLQRGYIVKFDYSFSKNIGLQAKEDIMIKDAKEILATLPAERLKRYLR